MNNRLRTTTKESSRQSHRKLPIGGGGGGTELSGLTNNLSQNQVSQRGGVRDVGVGGKCTTN